jgi:phosphatidylglycerol:prolipoprotein diacylglycerol transferase
VTLGIILGGRIGYVLFYRPGYYIENPLEALAVWHGGMAFHGGLAGAALAVILFAWRNRIPVLSYLDIVSCVAPPGIFLVRIANFINGELWGRVTYSVPWAMYFPTGGPFPRHPSQIYEALTEGVLLFVVLFAMTRLGALKRPGLVAGAFGIGYAVARSFCEFFREPDALVLGGPLTIGQAYSIPMVVIGIGLVVYALRRKPVTA